MDLDIITPSYIATVRFSNKTWEENNRFRKLRMKVNGCIYPVSSVITTIPHDAIIYVIEMNNDTNKIMGIGRVRNRPIYNKYQVYEMDTYNTFSYIGKKRIDKSEWTNVNEMKEMIEQLEQICFKGKGHLKRLKGIKILSKKNIEKIIPKQESNTPPTPQQTALMISNNFLSILQTIM